MTTEILICLILMAYAYASVTIVQRFVPAIRTMWRNGLINYFRYVAFRDIRFRIGCILLGCAICLAYSSPNLRSMHILLVATIFFWPIYGIAQGIAPPQILLLQTFADRNFPFAAAMAKGSITGKTVSAFPPVDMGAMDIARVQRAINALNRSASGASSIVLPSQPEGEWKIFVRYYMQIADVIVLDLSNARKGLFDEIAMIASDECLLQKLVVVQSDAQSGLAGLLELSKMVPMYPQPIPYGPMGYTNALGSFESFENARIRDLWFGQIGMAIKSRLRSQFPLVFRITPSLIVLGLYVVKWLFS